ncbi:MAG: hypothetical protein H6566_08895 [Lewinellaceae bacterium]|nr:hypothetical protein [Lewinellaceae bacterium]
MKKTSSVKLKAWAQLLRAGHLYAYETEALGCIHGLYDFISEQLLPEAALQIADQLVDQGTGRQAGARLKYSTLSCE